MIRLLFAVIVVASSLTVQARQTVTLGVSGRTVDAVAKHLNASADLQIQVRTFADDDALYAALRDGKVDLAFLGAVRYVQAHSEFGATPVVADGKASRTAIIVPASSTIISLKQLRGKRVAFGYKESTSTYLIPLLMLSRQGLQKDDVVGSFVSHRPQEQIDEMLEGNYDASAVSESLLAANKGKVRVLELSDPFAGPPLVARANFSADLVVKIRNLLVSYKPPADGGTNQRFSSGVVPVTDTDYNRIRFLCKVVLQKMYL